MHERAKTPRGAVATDPIRSLIERRVTRRSVIGGILAAGLSPSLRAAVAQRDDPSTLSFESLPNRFDATHHVAAGYDVDVLIRWGDPVVPGAPEFDVDAQDANSQAAQFGYDNDFIAFLPLPRGSESSTRGLLCVNHEYSRPELMWRGGNPFRSDAGQVAVEMQAQGHSIVEVERVDGSWRVVADGKRNRRISATTPIEVRGPAAGHPRMRTEADPAGRLVLGTCGNCAGGVTPWGTVLTAEENFHVYFAGDPRETDEAESHARYGLGLALVSWGQHEPRFDVSTEPNEPNRFGWIVEIDPFDPDSKPIKRTALGRCKHEGATVVVGDDGRVVVYTGDDEVFEYVYRFVSRGRFDPQRPAEDRHLLDDGTLFVARFDDESVEWLPVVFGEGPLTEENGFDSQAEVLIDARRAADLLGATPMDRPEDIEVDPVSGAVFLVLTNNALRSDEQVDGANPRSANTHGHIVRLVPPRGPNGQRDHAATKFGWDVFLLAGNPDEPGDRARYHDAVGADGWLSSPDNIAFDRNGRLWIATDQGATRTLTGIADGIRACDVRGAGAGLTKLFFAVPTGAESTGPCFTPDDSTLFVSVQHPAEGSTFDAPSTRWPDFDPKLPPRPSVVAITKRGGGAIGS